MKTITNTILLATTAIAALIIMAGTVMIWWIQSNHALSWLQSRINGMIPGTIAIEHHQLSLLKPSVALNGVILHAPEGAPLAGFDHFSLALSWWPLLRGEIRIAKIRITAPWADLAVHESQGLNLIAALIPDTDREDIVSERSEHSDFPFNIKFDNIRLTGGRIAFTTSDTNNRLAITGISVSAAANIKDRTGNLDLELEDVRFESDTIHPEPTRIDLQARLDGERLIVSALNAVSGQTKIRLTGAANQLTVSPKVEVFLTAKTHLEAFK